MRRKGFILGILLLLALAGCVARPVEQPLPTLAPQKEQEQEVSSEETGEEKEKEDSDGILGILSYVEKSKQAKDEAEADYLQTRLLIACIEAQADGVTMPAETIHFRYTEDFSEMDDTYGELKERLIIAEQGSTPISLSVEGNYMMVEITSQEDGMPAVKVEIMQE